MDVRAEPGSLERAVLGFARVLIPGSDVENALASLLVATAADVVMIDRLVFGPAGNARLVTEVQARRDGIDHVWVDFDLDDSLEQYRSFMAGELWVVHDSNAEDAPDRDAYARLDPPIRSELCIPVLADGVPVGQISFVFGDRPHRWSEDEIATLATAATIVQALWTQRSNAERLEAASTARGHSSRVTQALLACSQALLLESGEAALERALAEMLDATGAVIVYLDENVDHPELGWAMRTRYSVAIPAVPEGMFGWLGQAWPWAATPEAHDRLASGGIVAVESRSQLGERDSVFYREFEVVQAKIAAPIFVEGEWHSTVGLLDIRPRAWLPEHHLLVETVAAMFGAYWTRLEHERRMEEALAARDEFVASASHELRTPLAAVVGFASELRDRYEDIDEALRIDLIGVIARQAGDLSFLIDDLLVAARAQGSPLRMAPAVVDLGAEVVMAVAGMPPEYGVDLRLEAPAEVRAWADGRRLRQIIRNLVLNARKHGGPHCVVRLLHLAGTAVLEVADDGPEVPEEIRPTMFEAYSSGGESAAGPASLGLGLSVSRRLAELMGGRLEYRFDGWSVFALTLPATAPGSTATGPTVV
jgi:signal transduction histidine kinase